MVGPTKPEDSQGYSVTWVVIRDNEDLVRGIASIGPSDANLLALRERLEREPPQRRENRPR